MNFDELKIIKLPKHDDARGSLTFIEENSIIPFEIKRVYFTYNLKSDIGRGGHAHKINYGLIIAISGSFIVKTDDYFKKKEFYLSKPNEGLLIPPHYWRELYEFKNNAICLALGSAVYKEDEYIRSYSEFAKINTKAS